MITYLATDDRELYTGPDFQEFVKKLRESGTIPDEASAIIVQIKAGAEPLVTGYYL